MFWYGYLYKWEVPGEKRVRTANACRYILNTKRMFQITESPRGHETMIYFDNGLDEKDPGYRLETSYDFGDVFDFCDEDFGSNEVTLSYYPEGDITGTAVSITLRKEDVSYAFPRNFDDTQEYCWLHYRTGAWDNKRILVGLGWSDLYIALMT